MRSTLRPIKWDQQGAEKTVLNRRESCGSVPHLVVRPGAPNVASLLLLLHRITGGVTSATLVVTGALLVVTRS